MPTSEYHLGDALLTAAYILNRVPSKSISKTPYELWTCRRPDLSYMHLWGTTGFVHSNSHGYEKLGPKANKYIFNRYSDESKGYVTLGVQPDGTVIEIGSQDVVFLEREFSRKENIDDIDGFF